MEQQIAELTALVNVLRQQLHVAVDAACNAGAKVSILEARVRALEAELERGKRGAG